MFSARFCSRQLTPRDGSRDPQPSKSGMTPEALLYAASRYQVTNLPLIQNIGETLLGTAGTVGETLLLRGRYYPLESLA